MPLYDYRCRSCDERFEVRLGLDEARPTVSCPAGHTDTVRLFSPVAITGRAGGGAPARVAPPAPVAGCGGACACRPG